MQCAHLTARRRCSIRNATTPRAIDGWSRWLDPVALCTAHACTLVPHGSVLSPPCALTRADFCSAGFAASLLVGRTRLHVSGMQQPNGAAPVASTSQPAPAPALPAQPVYALPSAAAPMHAPVAGPSAPRTEPAPTVPYKRPRAPTPDELPSDEDVVSSDDEPVVPLLAGRKRRANAGSRCALSLHLLRVLADARLAS